MAIVEIIKDIVIPLLQVVSVPAAAVFSFAYKNSADKKINELKEQIRLNTEIPLTYKNGLWRDIENLPFCPVCYGKERYKIPLKKIRSQTYVTGTTLPARLHCHACKYEIDDPDEK